MKIISCSALAVAVCSCSCGQSRATTLQWQFPQDVGARYDVRSFSRTTTTQNKPMIRFEGRFDDKGQSGGKQRVFTLKSESSTIESLAFTVAILQKNAGGLRCRLTLRDWRMSLSEKENGKPSSSWTTWNKSILAASKIVRGTSFTFFLKSGKVSEVRGLKTFRSKLVAAAEARRNSDLANIAENRFNELYWPNVISQWTEGTNTKPLQNGIQWQFTRPSSFSLWPPLIISRKVTNLSFSSATLQDSATLNVDTTPRKNQNYHDEAIYAWKYKGSYQNTWRLDADKGWKVQSTGVTQWRGNSLIYGASKQSVLSLYSDTPTTFREETRLVATRLR